MDSYLMMLYVSIEQEKAMKKLFSDNGWKYCKPDILHLTDKLGGVHTSDLAEKSTETMHAKITSPPKTTKASVTSPQRPATRSQKSRMIEENTEHYDDLDAQTEKEECEDVVDDGDLNDYMEHGDEDDDYIDDDKEMKKITRQLTKSPDSNLSFTEREDFTAKLDGTEDIDPEDLTSADKCVKKRGTDKLQDYSKARSKFVKAEVPGLVTNSSTTKLPSVTERELYSATNIKGKTVVPSKKDGEQKRNKQKSEDSIHVINENKLLSDALCMGKDHGSLVSLQPNKRYRMKTASEMEKKLQNYTCDECGKVYSVRSCLKRHMKSHKPGVEHCSQCHMYFDNAEQLEAHKMKIHSTSYGCKLCRSQFSRKASLRKHVISAHPEHSNAKFSCPKSNCKAAFDDEELYRDHLNVHEGLTPHKCSQCDKAFPTRSLLKLHENKHNGDNVIKCKECGRQFKSYGSLHNHRVSVHEKKRFKCNQCNKVFIYRSGFCKHLLTHKKEDLETTSSLSCSIISEQKADIKEEMKGQEVADCHRANDKTVVGINAESTDQIVMNISNQACQMEIVGNQTVESMNQVETVVSAGLSSMGVSQGVSQMQTPVLAGQEVAVLPLSTVQLDPSARIMWICRT